MPEGTAADSPGSVVDGECTLPLTGWGVQRVITDLGVLDVTRSGLMLREVAPGISVDEVRAAPGPELAVAADLVVGV
ncbi:hypothetical protein ACIP6Q_32955 [Streptomyces bobili]|uniref:hypothetical protein n=1 Tax=Streptomyces bobili TaxID=67280 RepID=UPI0038273463